MQNELLNGEDLEIRIWEGEDMLDCHGYQIVGKLLEALRTVYLSLCAHLSEGDGDGCDGGKAESTT